MLSVSGVRLWLSVTHIPCVACLYKNILFKCYYFDVFNEAATTENCPAFVGEGARSWLKHLAVTAFVSRRLVLDPRSVARVRFTKTQFVVLLEGCCQVSGKIVEQLSSSQQGHRFEDYLDDAVDGILVVDVVCVDASIVQSVPIPKKSTMNTRRSIEYRIETYEQKNRHETKGHFSIVQAWFVDIFTEFHM